MPAFQTYLSKRYYKIRIILTFCFVTVVLVFLLSQLSYLFIRSIYLEQIEEQAIRLAKSISKQIDNSYLNLLEIGFPTESMRKYLREILKNNLSDDSTISAFLFDSEFKIFVHSDDKIKSGKQNSQLFLFKKEIAEAGKYSAAVSMPFKGNDEQWYLFSFLKLEDNVWLAVRESARRLEKVDEFSRIFWFIGFGGVILSLFTGWFLARSITQPLDKLINFSNKIGKGDANASLPQNLKGEIKHLADAMEKMRSDLSVSQKEKENMLAQIAHEIRNPLGGIELLTNLTKEDLAKGQVKEDYLNKISAEINGLKSLISSYLNYSRPTNYQPSMVDILETAEAVKSIFYDELKNKNVKFNLKIDAPKIWFDGSHLKQIMINLCSNALDAVNYGGWISIHSFEKGNKLYIEFSDNGKGIPSSEIMHIFDPFFTTKKEGTGLGLAICKKLCLENNCQLNVESEAGNGAKFIIEKEKSNEQ